MVKNYLLIAFRFYSRQRGFSIINVFGLTVGIACSLLILLYVQDELRYDTFHKDGKSIYRISTEAVYQGKISRSTLTGFPVAESLNRMEGVTSTMRIAAWKTFPVRYNEQVFTEPYLLLADPDFFKFFSFELIEGNPDSVLIGERKLVITESAARRYFDYKGQGDKTPIGKTVILAQGYTATVSGVAADPPKNSHFHFTLILSLSSWEDREPGDWFSGKVITYVKLDKPTNHHIEAIREKLNSEYQSKLTALNSINDGASNAKSASRTVAFQSLHDIHLHSNLNDEIEINGNIEYIYLFSSIAAFVTLLACINFMNLTTAQSASRAKEVAVRKAVGAQNNRLIAQFLFESYFYVILAVILAFMINLVAIIPFNYFTGKGLTFGTLFSAPFIGGIIVFVVITGLVAGSYPAFYLTHFSPVEVLKGVLRERVRSYGIRNLLVVFQFFISAGLIIATLVVYRQLQYVQTANVGFEKENVINLLHTKNLGANAVDFKKELLKQPGVVSASYCNRLPPNIDWQAVFRTESAGKDFSLVVYEMDYDHFQTMGYTLTSGRFFTTDANDSIAVILNETAVARMNLTKPLGKKLFTTYDNPARERTVIGVVKDFNFQSLKNPIQPLAIILGYQPNWEMAIRINGNPDDVMANVKTLFTRYAPEAPVEFSMVEKNFAAQHESEKKIGLLFVGFTVLAMIIACLGLFGLASFTAEQQRKAIGIRKVLGASITSIVILLNKDFLRLVLIANVIAWPVAGWLMHQWLSQFAYHANIPWWIFLTAGMITFLIAFISISSKGLRAATGNPVNSLRNE